MIKKWIKETAKKIFNLYTAVVIATYVVFLCNMAISYFHAWGLFSDIGHFPGLFAYIAVVAFDTVFAVCVLIISKAKIKKIEVGGAVWFGAVFGGAITGWSNVRASMGETEWYQLVTFQFSKISPQGWESMIAGLSTLVSLIAIESLLSWMTEHKDKFIPASNTEQKPSFAEHKRTEQIPPEQIEQTDAEPNMPIAEHRTKIDSIEQPHHTEHERTKLQIIEQTNLKERPNTEQKDENTEHEPIQQTLVSDATEQAEIEQPNSKDRTAQTEQIEHKVELNEQTNNTEHRTTEQDSIEHKQGSNTEQPNIEQSKGKIEQTNKPKRRTKKSNTNLYVVRSNKTSKTEQAAQCALEWLEQNKEFTVRDLADELGCAVSTAQNALNKARERYQKQA
ncbi:hypothetical protein [Laceyella sacchari]|uniref:DUF2637 domain-containing protein n=1 Tax=Laceyella sacchari TaxID=37482 RepID=A0ABY5U9M7_LACSH|nr:hypothetical protein [Laceyella sacchari]UWE05325.1 hypothetical protein NYR52_16535 [Laceyella sacchari]